MSRVTLIIPSFNNARFLPECLASALAQTRPFDEIIVVDDASQDDSVRIVEAASRHAQQIRLIALPRRQGVAAARHAGISAATTPFITTIDADDFFWNVKKNELEMSLVEAALPQTHVVAFSDVQRVSVSGESLGAVSRHRKILQGSLFGELLRLKCFVPRDFTFSRISYYESGCYDQRFSLYEDWDLKLRLSRFCDFRFTGALGVAYRSNPNGLSSAPLGRHLRAMYEVMIKNTRGIPQPRRHFIRMAAFVSIMRFLRGGINALLRKWARL